VLEPKVEFFRQVVKRSDPVIERLVFLVLPGDGASEIGNALTNGISLPRSHIDQGIRLEFQRLVRFRIAEQSQSVRFHRAALPRKGSMGVVLPSGAQQKG